MDYISTIQTLKAISETQTDAGILARNIIEHIKQHAGKMIIDNTFNVESVIKVAYAIEMALFRHDMAYAKIIDLYNRMIQMRGSKYMIRLLSNIVSLPSKEIIAYSDTPLQIDGFLEMEIAISGSRLELSLVGVEH